jgi:hypothetical protein
MEECKMANDANLTFNEVAVTASKNGSNINIGPTGIVEAEVSVSNVSGTSPTMDLMFEDSNDGTIFEELVGVPQFTEAGKKSILLKSDKKYLRYALTIAGTSPSFDVTVKFQ